MKWRNRFLVAVAAVLLAGVTAFAGEAFTFVQLCDPQLGHNNYEQDKAAFRQAVEQINALGPDLVLICGDLVNDATSEDAWADFLAIKAELKMPCYCVPGNHDVGNEAAPGLVDKFRQRFGKDYKAFEHKGYTFLLTNTSLWKVNSPGASAEHDRWFTESLKAAHAKKSPVLVVGHIPPFTESPGEAEHYFDLPPEKRAEVLRLSKEYGVVAFLMGHVHRNCVTEYEGIPVVASASTCKNSGAPPDFRVWRVAGDGTLTHKYVELKSAAP